VRLAYLYLAATGIAAGTTLLVTPYVRRLALHVGMLDQTGDRRMHADPKPRIGGLAVYLGFAFALFATLGYAIEYTPLFHNVHDLNRFLGLLFGGTLILIFGVWDDVVSISPRGKLLAQIVVALVSMSYGFTIQSVENPFRDGEYFGFPPYLSIPITLLWYLGIMNAINFLDGLDGLLSGFTAISGFFLFLIAVSHHYDVAALVLCALIGGTLGFLRYNFNPASIILGDTGSLFIGYMLATVGVLTTSKTALTVSLAVPLLALALPVVDIAAAIVRRTRAGRKFYEADRGHIHHVLVFQFGLNVRQAVLLIYAVTFILGVAAYALAGGFSHPLKLAGAAG
jgi:UDP-GlcNAc:undecaprenyl-phosphate GlcNAc-1-phosphate transferase